MKRKICVALLAVIISMNGCGTTVLEKTQTQKITDSEEKEDNTAEKIQEVEEVKNHAELETTVEVICKEVEEEIKASDGTVVCRCSWDYPEITLEGNERAIAAIREEWDKKVAETKEEVESILENPMEINQEFPNGWGPSTGVSWELLSDKNGVLAFERNIWGHGSEELDKLDNDGCVNYDMTTGQVLLIKDVLEQEEEGKKEIKEALIKQINMMSFEEYENSDLVNRVDDIIGTENWYFSKVGIHFIIGNDDFEYGTRIIIPYDEVTMLKEKYKPQIKAWAVADGSSKKMDLNGDGTEEEIYYKKLEEEDEPYEPELVINGVDYGGLLDDESWGFSCGTREYCYLVDLDDRDSYIEIAVGDYGYGEYKNTHFYRYDKENIMYLGCIRDAFDSYSCSLLGEGRLLARELDQWFQSGRLEKEYIIFEEQLSLLVKEWYELDMSEYLGVKHQNCNFLKNVTVYTQDNAASATKILTSSDGPVIFLRTDYKEWVELQTKDGKIYYIHMLGDFEMENGYEKESVSDVFENLLLV